MADSITLKSSSYDGRYMKLVCKQTPNGGAENTSTIKWTLSTVGGNSSYYSTGATKVVINGTTVYSKARVDWSDKTFPASVGSKSGEITVSHSDDGTKSIKVSFTTAIYTTTESTYSDTWELDPIARYGTSKQSLNSKTETTIKMNWASDNTVDYLWYSKDNGSNWTGVNVTDGKSGTYTISDLTANTTYKIKTRIRRKDSQLTTDSSVLSVTTYNYPYCTSSPDFVLGDNVTLKFYNPLKRAFTFYIIGNGTQIDVEYDCESTSYTGISSPKSSVPYLYATIPNDTSGKYKVKVVYGSSTITRDNGNTYSVNESECLPTFTDFTYKDTNTTVTAVTGDNQVLVKGLSTLSVEIPATNKMVTKNSATPKNYIASIDKLSKTIAYGEGSLFMPTAENFTLNMTHTINADGSVLATGYTSGQGALTCTLTGLIPNERYTFSLRSNNSSVWRASIFGLVQSITASGNESIAFFEEYYATFVCPENGAVKIKIGQWGITDTTTGYDGSIIFYPQLELGDTMSEWKPAVSGVLGAVSSAGVKRLNVTAYDSRTLPKTAYKDITIYDYGKPVINATVTRLNNFEAQTTIKVSGTYSPLNINGTDKNAIQSVKYRYREIGGEWSKEVTINTTISAGNFSCNDVVISLDRAKSFEVEIIATDKLDSHSLSIPVGVGQAIFFISTNKKVCYINGVEVPTFDTMYPVGSVYCSSTNTNPSTMFGGTWELIDKGFKSGSTTVTQTATEYLSQFVVDSFRVGQTIRFRLSLTTAKEINDAGVTIGTIDFTKHGLQADNGSYISLAILGDVAISDGESAVIDLNIDNNGDISTRDVLVHATTGNTHVLPVGASFYYNFTTPIYFTKMADEFCDKFYWKRTA